jgi:putative nucleotidyltransferase with HDIG domain
MENLPCERPSKRPAQHRMEILLVTCIVLAACLIQWGVPHKMIALNFFVLPTIVTAYCLGIRAGSLTALLAFLVVAVDALVRPERFLFAGEPFLALFALMIWGAFLGLTALVIGLLRDRLDRHRQDLQVAYVGVLEILVKFLESADQYSKSHAGRVADLSTAIAAEMGLGAEAIEVVRAGALLHDIGKTEAIHLVKQAAVLTEFQRAEVARHTLVGVRLVKAVGTVLQDTVPIIQYHHHHFGGRPGYLGPTGTDIPLGARIVAVADAFDAIVTDRPYRRGRAPWQALHELEACAGTQFDPEVIQAFKRVLPRDFMEPERELTELASHRAAMSPCHSL